MPRNKCVEPLTKKERKNLKNGVRLGSRGGPTTGIGHYDYSAAEMWSTKRRTKLDTRRPAKTNSASIVHAVLFCVLAVIVASWALGY